MLMALALSVVSLIAMWIFFFVALIFYEEGDDKRTLLLSACVVFDLLAVFSLLIPTYSVVELPAYNVTTTNTIGNTVYIEHYPAYNQTLVNPPFSNPVITLYTVFAVFQGFIFLIFAIWSFKSRLQYMTSKQYKAEMEKNRRQRGLE